MSRIDPVTATLHIIFGDSAGGSLRRAIQDAGRADRVVALSDDLSYGPIDPPDPALRAEWIGHELGSDGWADVLDRAEKDFWETALSWRGRRVAWLSRRSTRESCGFLEFVRRSGGTPIEVVDVTDLPIRNCDREANSPPRLLISLGEIWPHAILQNGLFDRAVIPPGAIREQDHRVWQALRNENAPLRVIDHGKLVSAMMTHFDALVLSCARPDWLKVARVVGEAMALSWDGEFHQTGDLVLFSRVNALIETGALEAQGDRISMRSTEVRLARTFSAS